MEIVWYGRIKLQTSVSTSFFDKVFEKLAYTHILNFINKNNLLSKNQLGFRSKNLSALLITL